MNASTASLARGAHVEHMDLRAVSFHHVRFAGLELVDVEITGETEGVTINGVDIGPLVEAELDRRMPDRTKMQPTTVEGFQETWATLERLWAETTDRARALPPELLHERVGDEWSFIETLRHLGFASAAWVSRMLLGEAVPWHPLDLAVRHRRQVMVRDVITSLTSEQLDETVTRTEPGWPQLTDFPLAQCLFIVVNEEWHHQLYAERELDALTASTKTED